MTQSFTEYICLIYKANYYWALVPHPRRINAAQAATASVVFVIMCEERFDGEVSCSGRKEEASYCSVFSA